MAVLFGIAGSLAGVVIGAFLTRWIDAGYERRREVRSAIGSALSLQEALRDVEQALKVMIENKKGTSAFLFSGLDKAWESHRDILLAVGMRHSDWRFLAETFRQILEITTHLKSSEEEISEENLAYLQSVRDDCADGRARLEPFAVDSDIPFLYADSIFPARRANSRAKKFRWAVWHRRRNA